MVDKNRQKRPRTTETTLDDVMVVARMLWGRENPYAYTSALEEDRMCRDWFGCGPAVLLDAWNLLVAFEIVPNDGTLEHMLWSFIFMKQYPKSQVLKRLCGGHDLKTIRYRIRDFIESLATTHARIHRRKCFAGVHCIWCNVIMTANFLFCLFQIVWENRFKNDRGADCTISVDCVDFRIPNHGPHFASHKFKKKSGLRYEIANCLQTGDAVWINGPYPCGDWPDISIFRDSLMSHLEDGERVEADDGYVGESPRHIKCPKSFTNLQETEYMQQRVRSRQETINNRLKFWEILKIPFRHSDILISHGDIVRAAILCIAQVSINHGERLFETGYKDPPYTAADPNNPPLNTGWQRREQGL